MTRVFEVPGSKSEIARAFILSSFLNDGELRMNMNARADDVMVAKRCMLGFRNGEKEFHCGDSATFFRFLALRVSRQIGHFKLMGSERLLQRPHDELLLLLESLGVHVWWESDERSKKFRALHIRSQNGWQAPPDGTLRVSVYRSSQFLSALLLSSWNLPFDLQLRLHGEMVSKPYFEMTRSFVEKCGMEIAQESVSSTESLIKIKRHQKIIASEVPIESDWSTGVFLLTFGTVEGDYALKSFIPDSLQADAEGLKLLLEMGADIKFQNNLLFVKESSTLRGIDCDLKNSPDLFPVLCALSALPRVRGMSNFRSLGHLEFKESHRPKKLLELLSGLGAKCRFDGDIFEVLEPISLTQKFYFDPRPDHRLVMAGKILTRAGANLELADESVISKSFPEFAQFEESCLA